MTRFAHDSLDFDVDQDAGHFLAPWPVAAPEIIKHNGEYFVAGLVLNYEGIRSQAWSGRRGHRVDAAVSSGASPSTMA